MAVARGGQVRHNIGLIIAAEVGIAQVIVHLVGPGHKVGADRHQVIHHQEHLVALDADGRTVARRSAHGVNLLHRGRAHAARVDGVGELGFIQFHVATQHSKDEAVDDLSCLAVGLRGAIHLGHEKDRLGCLIRANVQEVGQGGNGGGARRVHLFQRQLCARGRLRLAEGGYLAIGAVVTVVANNDRVLTNRQQRHKLVRHAAAHHAHIALHGNDIHACAAEDIEVGLVDVRVEGIQTRLVAIKRVRILHGELAHTNDAGARARLVAEFGLDLVEHKGKLAIAADNLLRHVGHDLFVRHAQHHVAPVAILEARHVITNLIPAPRLLPQFGGMHHRQRDFLAANRVHLLADDPFNFALDAQPQRQEIKDARSNLLDHACTHQQVMADHVGVGGGVSQCLEEEARHAHGRGLQSEEVKKKVVRWLGRRQFNRV